MYYGVVSELLFPKVHPFVTNCGREEMNSLVVLALVCVTVGCVLRAGRKIWTRHFQDKDHPQQWKQRPAALTSVQMFVASLSFFIWAGFSSEPLISTDMKTFLCLVLAAGGLAIFNMFFRTFLQGLKGVTLAGPVEALVPLGAVVTGLFFGEDLPFNYWGLAGIIFMVLGLYKIALHKALLKMDDESRQRMVPEGQKIRLTLAPFLFARENPAVLAALMVVLLGSIGVHLDARLARSASVPWAFGCVFGISGVGNFLWALYKSEFKDLKLKHLLWAALPGTLFALGNGVTNYAYRFANTSYIAALKRGDVILTLIGGRKINKETEDFSNRLIGGALIAIGAALITIAIRMSE